jgi:hypothetical protein
MGIESAMRQAGDLQSPDALYIDGGRADLPRRSWQKLMRKEVRSDLSMANCYFAKPHGMQHCYIPFLYVIDFKSALNFGEAQGL